MSELGDLLEVVHGAHRSFTSVRLEAREWRHNPRLQLAYGRAVERAGGTSYAPAGEVPAETEVAVRAWFEQPNRVREERDEAGHGYVAVADGTRWWQRLPRWATTSAAGDGWASGQVGHALRPLLEPWPLVAGLELAVEGAAEVAGRTAVVARAAPRPHPHGGGGELLPYGADRHELAFDRERGVVLRTRAFLDEEPFSVVEVVEVAFDEPLDDAVFAFVPQAGEQVVRPEEVTPGDVVTVEEAARRASFTVLAPRSLGRGWRSHVLYTPGREGTPVRETVHLALYRDDATHAVSLRQTAGPWESWQTNGTEEAERDGRRVRVSVGPWHRVLLEERGTFVELDSQTVETEALLELALALEPAPTERPPLLP
jgi:outer membrane lipoprotein-sorting protein